MGGTERLSALSEAEMEIVPEHYLSISSEHFSRRQAR